MEGVLSDYDILGLLGLLSQLGRVLGVDFTGYWEGIRISQYVQKGQNLRVRTQLLHTSYSEFLIVIPLPCTFTPLHIGSCLHGLGCLLLFSLKTIRML
jgi:hypothetical protein